MKADADYHCACATWVWSYWDALLAPSRWWLRNVPREFAGEFGFGLGPYDRANPEHHHPGCWVPITSFLTQELKEALLRLAKADYSLTSTRPWPYPRKDHGKV